LPSLAIACKIVHYTLSDQDRFVDLLGYRPQLALEHLTDFLVEGRLLKVSPYHSLEKTCKFEISE
jgi:hypothetical protein